VVLERQDIGKDDDVEMKGGGDHGPCPVESLALVSAGSSENGLPPAGAPTHGTLLEPLGDQRFAR
jgi:hypothetical protein